MELKVGDIVVTMSNDFAKTMQLSKINYEKLLYEETCLFTVIIGETIGQTILYSRREVVRFISSGLWQAIDLDALILR